MTGPGPGAGLVRGSERALGPCSPGPPPSQSAGVHPSERPSPDQSSPDPSSSLAAPPPGPQLLPPAPLGERPPWWLTRGRAAAVLVAVAAGFAVIGTIFVRSAMNGSSTWTDVHVRHGSAGAWVSLLVVVVLGWVVRAGRRTSDRRLEVRLRPVEAVVVARRWRPAPHAPVGSWAQRSAWRAVRARPYQVTLQYVVDGRAYGCTAFTAQEPVVGSTTTIRYDEQDPGRSRC